MRIKKNLELYDSLLLNDKQHKDSQHIIGVCKQLIVAGRFDAAYAVSSLSRFSQAPRVIHIVKTRIISGYLERYLKRGYTINPKPLIVDANYDKVQMKYDFGNHFSEEIENQFPEPLLDKLYIRVFVYANRGHGKVTGRSITAFFSVVVSTPATW